MDELFKVVGDLVGSAIEDAVDERFDAPERRPEAFVTYERFLCGGKRELGVNDR